MHPIRQFRLDHALSQQGFCQLLAQHGVAVSAGLISHWETGRHQPTPDQWPAIEQATNGAVTRADLRPDIFDPPLNMAA